MKVGRKEQRKINCKAKSEMKKLVEDDHKERQEDGENPYGKLKKDVEHEKCERVEKIDIISCHWLFFNPSCFCVG